jgi:hypothetical protein
VQDDVALLLENVPYVSLVPIVKIRERVMHDHNTQVGTAQLVDDGLQRRFTNKQLSFVVGLMMVLRTRSASWPISKIAPRG